MKKITYPKHYVCFVPLWLSRMFDSGKVPATTLISYERLCAITSPSDVCFYHLYQLARKPEHVEFGDMQSIITMDENLRWLERNEAELLTAKIEFDRLLKVHSKDIMGDTASEIVRKCSYVPKAAGEATLALLADVNGNMQSPKDFYKACILELDQQVLYDNYKTFRIYSRYCL